MATVDIREVRKAFGSTQILHGVSVGIEDVEDLIEDIEQALAKIPARETVGV